MDIAIGINFNVCAPQAENIYNDEDPEGAADVDPQP